MKYHRHLLQSCLQALNGIFHEDRHADKCIEYYLRNNRKWGSRDRRFFAETVYDCVRWWPLYWHLANEKPGQANWNFLGASLWNRNLPKPNLEEFTKCDFNEFENRYKNIETPFTREAFPKWLYNKLSEEIADWDSLAPYFNKPNQLVLRVNESRISRSEVIKDLLSDDIEAQELAGTGSGIIINKRVNIFQNPMFKKGFIEVQDGSSQNVAPFLELEPGMRVIDACAGAGGKTLHIADLLANRGKIISMDIHQWKLDQLKLRARRNQFSNIEMKVIDSSKVIKRMKETADRLLLDVPCSGLGVLRRNPDTKWKISVQQIEELQGIQADLLTRYSQMLKPGGIMVYATCSVLPSENEKQVEKFLEKNSNFQLLKQKKYMPTRPGFDGFYLAQLEKN